MDVFQQQPAQASPMQQQLSQQSKVVRTPTQIQPQYQHVEQQSVPAEFTIKEVPGLKNCNTNPFDTDNTDITLSSSNPSNTQITHEDILITSSSEKLPVTSVLDMERETGVTENAISKTDAKGCGVDTVDNVKLSQTNANISVATNIANAFINITNLNANVGGGGIINSPSVAGVSTPNIVGSNVNVIVSQPISQHFMKTLTFSTSRGGIFVPNITTNIPSQFTVHHHQFGLNSGGPAPNVTVNPNGNFNTNSNATIRPGAPNHFRLLLQQSPNINFNIIGGKGTTNKTPAVQSNQSPILEASLQTINKLAAAVQPNVVNRSFTPSKTACVQLPQKPIQLQTVTSSSAQKVESNEQTCSELNIPPHQASSLANTARNVTPSLSDQHIRVLTPLEIMRTLPPSLSTQDSPCFKVRSTELLQNIDSATECQNTSNSIVASFELPSNIVANSPSTSNLTYTTSTNLITVTTNTTTVTSNAHQMVRTR